MNKPAFTLLETLLYLALAAIFLGGVLAGVYNLIQSMRAQQGRILLQEEGDFLLGKFLWASEGAKEFAVSPDGKKLDVNNYNFDLYSQSLRISINSSSPITLSNNSVLVKNLNFGYLDGGVEIKFSLQIFIGSDKSVEQDFTFAEYLNQ